MTEKEEREAADAKALLSVCRAQQAAAQVGAWMDMGQPQPLPAKYDRFLRRLLRKVAHAKPRDVALMLGKQADDAWPATSAVIAGNLYMRTLPEKDGGRGWSVKEVAEHLEVSEKDAARTIAFGRRVFRQGVFGHKKARKT